MEKQVVVTRGNYTFAQNAHIYLIMFATQIMPNMANLYDRDASVNIYAHVSAFRGAVRFVEPICDISLTAHIYIIVMFSVLVSAIAA